MNVTKPLLVIAFGIGWFLYHLIRYHRIDWLVPVVFIVIGLYLKNKE